MTHDHKRHSTTTPVAVLNAAEGKIIGRCMQRHGHQEFIRFLNPIETEAPVGRFVHVILDKYATHKHPKVKAWLAEHPRIHVHFTPAHASWMNMEIWFGIVERRAIRRGVFKSVKDLNTKNPRIHRWLERPKPPLRLDQDRRPDPRESQPLNNFESTPLDEILGNATDIPITEHATDTHGVTLVNFGLLDLLPRCWPVSSRRPVARTRWPRRSRSTGRCGERSMLPATCPTRRIGARSPGSSTRATRCTL